MKRAVILGGAGIGMIAAAQLEASGVDVLGFLNDALAPGTEIGRHETLLVLGPSSDVHRLLRDPDVGALVAWVGLKREREAYANLVALDIPRDRLITSIAQSASVPWGHTLLGAGVMLAPGATLSPDTEVGDNCILLAGSFLGHDSTMERYAHLAAHATVGARVKVGKAVHVGLNATVREDVTIGDFAVIGAGAVVLHDVPEGAVVVGNPARMMRAP